MIEIAENIANPTNILYNAFMDKPFNYNDLTFAHIFSEKVDKKDFFSHHHDNYELLYIINGSGVFFVDNIAFNFKSQSLIIIPPGKFHLVKELPKYNYERCVISFSPDLIPPVIATPQISYYSDLKNNIKDILAKFSLYSELYSKDVLYALYKSLLNELLINLSFNDSTDILPHKFQAPPIVIMAIKFIDSHINDRLTINLISQDLFCSQSKLQQTFRNTMNISIMKYVSIKKMYKAKEYLQEGISAQQVAELLGYKDYPTFYRCYRSVFKVSPTYKKRDTPKT